MSVKQKLDVVDLVINVLREHERALDSLWIKYDSLIKRLESVSQELEQEILEKKPKTDQDRTVKISIIINILENRAFTTPLFSFDKKPGQPSDHFLIDHVKERTLIFGKSLARANIPLWNTFFFQGTEEPYGEPLESYYFDSERMMLAWIVKYMLRELEIEDLNA